LIHAAETQFASVSIGARIVMAHRNGTSIRPARAAVESRRLRGADFTRLARGWRGHDALDDRLACADNDGTRARTHRRTDARAWPLAIHAKDDAFASRGSTRRLARTTYRSHPCANAHVRV